MSQSLGNTIADSLQLSLNYAKSLLKDVQPESFGRFATLDGQTVESNHAAFIYGHLSLYASQVLEDVGHPPLAVPSDFAENFSKDCKCVDDPDSKLPSMNVITEYFFESFQKVIDVLRETDDETLQQANKNTKMTRYFPTMGSMLNFYCGGHMMVHLGQMSAWRRMHGLGSA